MIYIIKLLKRMNKDVQAETNNSLEENKGDLFDNDSSSDSSCDCSSFEEDFDENPYIDNVLKQNLEQVSKPKEFGVLQIPQGDKKILIYDSKAKIMK